MKTNHWTKTIGVLLLSLGLFKPASGFAQTLAIQSGSSIDAAQADSIVQIAAESQGLAQIAPADLPIVGGTFWWVMPGGAAVPAPCAPLDLNGAIYQIAEGQFLVDETGGQVVANAPRFGLRAQSTSSTVASEVASQADAVVNLITQVQTATANQQMQTTMQTMGMDVPFPGDGGSGDGGTNAYTSNYSSYTVNYGTNLWIAQFSVSSGNVSGIVSNTQPGVEYEIQAKTDLLQSDWISEGLIPGSKTTNWTPFSIAAFSPTNNLFLRIRSWISSDGSGLPDWWELQYFGHTGVDPDADPDGDGMSNWEEFEAGTDPTTFNPPSGINNFQATITGTTTVLLTWNSAPGPVTSYTIDRYDRVLNQEQYFTVAATIHQFVDTNYINYPAWELPIVYMVYANYATDNSGSSTASPLVEYGIPTAEVVMGNGGGTGFAVTGIPADAAGVQITRLDYLNRFYPTITAGSNSFFVPANAFANGAYFMATNLVGLGPDGSDYYVQTVWSNGVSSQPTEAGYVEGQQHRGVDDGDIFVKGRFNDGSTHLEQNAIFLLRAAGLTGPFVYSFDFGYGQSPVYQPTNYAYASFWRVNEHDTYVGMGDYSGLDWSIPFWQNYQLRNFVFSTANVNSSGFLNTGADGNYELINPTTFAFPATNTVGLLALLPASQTTWMVPYSDPSKLGITTSGGYFHLPNNIYNYFGLKLLSVMVAHNHAGTLYFDTLNPNGTLLQTNDAYYFYPQFDQPNLQTVGYYFGRSQNNAVNGYFGEWLGSDPLPGNYAFSPTYAQPLLIGSVGTPLQVGAFAEQVILNGDITKPVYVSEYFDKAYKVDSNGNVTTNQTGILSPYGDFLPTEPGPTALVTLPASDGQRGTGIVYVVSLQLDVNHDGNMQSSLFGPDSVWNTMNFWVNELYDQPGNGTTLDQDFMVNQNQGGSFNTNLQPNYAYQQITCQRDLENFARLWIRGLPSLPASQGYSVTLSLDSWGGSINLYQAVETSGGMDYLTDTNIAAAQVAAPYGNALASLWDSDFTLPMNAQGNPTMTNFLFEGAAIPGWGDGTGMAGIVLTVSQNGQPIAQSEVYVNLSHVKDMYERAQVTNVVQTWPEMVQQTNTSGFQVLSSPGYSASESKQLAVFVHGWRMTAWDTEKFSDTMFKRLYWQGFQGRFASLRWPTRSAETDTNGLDYLTFNRSEHIAFESGTGAAAYFNNLRQRFTNDTISACAHSQGNILMMEALKELAAANQRPLDNYVMMQAAVPAHCYDTTVPYYHDFTNEEQIVPTPNTYANYAAGIANALRGQIVNFFNTNDYALVSATTNISGMNFNVSWIGNEELTKPLAFFGYSYNPANSTAYLTNINYGVTGRTVTNAFELMPFVARPRSLAAGAQSGVGQTVNGGEFDLKTIGFSGNDYDHSGEFNRNIQTPQVHGFYTNLTSTLFPH